VKSAWAIFERERAGPAERKFVTWCGVLGRLADRLARTRKRPFDFAAIETQDVDIAEAPGALVAGRPDALFFTLDLSQGISSLAIFVEVARDRRLGHLHFRPVL
jgi:hypothetical protein